MIIEALVQFLNSKTKELGLPTVMVDYLATRDSLALQTVTQEAVEKTYIDGSTIRKCSFRLIRKGSEKRTSSKQSLKIIESLNSLAGLFEEMTNYPLDESTTIITAAVSSPSVLYRTEDSEVAYGLTIAVTYKQA